MDMSQWFHQQLQSSMEGLQWAVEQIPQNHLYSSSRPDRWPVARIVYHLAQYEQRIGLPTMQQWLGGTRPVVGEQKEDALIEERDWNGGQGYEIDALLATFVDVRSQQIALLPQFQKQQWYEERDVIWGTLPLVWVVTKTYQHTLEHTDEILRNYLWWR